MSLKDTNILPSEAYPKARRLAIQAIRQANGRATAWPSGATSAEILSAADNLNAFRTILFELSQVPGIAVFAKIAEDDPTYDVQADFIAIIAAIDAALAEIVTTLPKDGNGWLLIHKINADGSLTPRSFAGSQLSGLITLMNGIVNSV